MFSSLGRVAAVLEGKQNASNPAATQQLIERDRVMGRNYKRMCSKMSKSEECCIIRRLRRCEELPCGGVGRAAAFDGSPLRGDALVRALGLSNAVVRLRRWNDEDEMSWNSRGAW